MLQNYQYDYTNVLYEYDKNDIRERIQRRCYFGYFDLIGSHYSAPTLYKLMESVASGWSKKTSRKK